MNRKEIYGNGLRQFVKERKEGIIDRRRFLKALGSLTVGGVGLAFVPKLARGQKKITINMWDTEPNPATRGAMKEITADFHRLHPDIEVISEAMGWADMERKLQTALAAKTPPAACHGQTYTVTSFQPKGIIEPIDDLINAIGEDRIFPHVLRWSVYNGRYYGLTHAWGADFLGGRGDFAKEAGINPSGWKTWDDWLRDLPKLNKPPRYYALSLSGVPHWMNQYLAIWIGANGGRIFDDAGNPVLDSPQALGALELWRKLKPYLPPAWSSHDYLEILSAFATGRVAQVFSAWMRAAGYIDQYAPPEKRNPEIFQIWPRTIGPMGKTPLTQFDNENWMIFSDAPKEEKNAAKEFLKFFYKKENYWKYCNSVPVHLNSIFKDDFKDPGYLGHPDRKRWKPWLDFSVASIEGGRSYPLLMCDPKDRMVPWIGDVATSPIMADMIMAVATKGEDPKKAAKEANMRISRDIIDKWKKA